MCGRFSLVADTDELAERFQFDDAGLTLAPGYNIAPTQMAFTVKNEAARRAAFMRWGLMPLLGQERIRRQPYHQRPVRRQLLRSPTSALP